MKAEYAAAGIKIIVSLFGSTDTPTTNGNNPIATANTMAAWVKKFNLDGVDVDYEVFCGFNNLLIINAHLVAGPQRSERRKWKGRGKILLMIFLHTYFNV